MFNSSIAAHNLLTRRADCGILKSYSSEACFSMCSNITEGVLRSPEGTTQTTSHLNFALEVIGYSFSLPIEARSIAVIHQAISIYELWLFNCPKCAISSEQNLMKDVLGHFTLLFHNKTTHVFIQSHSDLALSVISTIHKFVVVRAKAIEAETWEYLVRLLLGAADCIFEGPVISSSDNFSSNMSVPLMRLIFEVFVRSLAVAGIVEGMWELLDRFMGRWTHRSAIVQQWNELCLSMTKQLLLFLPQEAASGGRDNTSEFLFPQQWTSFWTDTDGLDYQLSLSSEQLKFSWHRVLHCIGNPNNVATYDRNKGLEVSNEKALSAAVSGVCAIAETILLHSFWLTDLSAEYISSVIGSDEVCGAVPAPQEAGDMTHSASTVSPDEENRSFWRARFSIVPASSILRLLGGWLFEAALKAHLPGEIDVEDSRALAVATLGRLFTSRYLSGTNWHQCPSVPGNHHSRYLLCLRYAFNTNRSVVSEKVLASALSASWRVLSCSIPGVETIVDDCLDAVEEVVRVSADSPALAKLAMGTQSLHQQAASATPTAIESSPRPITPASSITSRSVSPRPPKEKDSHNTFTGSTAIETSTQSPTETIRYGGFDVVELRRAAVMLLTTAIARQSWCTERPSGRSTLRGMGLLLKLLKTETNVHNLQMIAWALPFLPVNSPYWSSADSDARDSMIQYLVGCLKEHTSVDLLSACVKSLGLLANAHSRSGSIRLAGDIVKGTCDFIRLLLSCFVLTVPPRGSSAQGTSDSRPAIPSSRVPTTRRVQNIVKGNQSRGVSSSAPVSLNLSKTEILYLIDVCFQSLLEWISVLMNSSFTHESSWIFHEVYDASMLFISTLSSKHASQFFEIDYAVYKLLDFLLLKCGRFPSGGTGPASCGGSAVCEHEDSKGCWTSGIPSLSHLKTCPCDELDNMTSHYLIDGDIILSIFDPNHLSENTLRSDSKALVAIMRSKHGKFVCELASLASTEVNQTQVEVEIPPTSNDLTENLDIPNSLPSRDGLLTAFFASDTKSDLLLPMQSINCASNDQGSLDPPKSMIYGGSHRSPELSISSLQRDAASCLELSTPLYSPFLARLEKQKVLEESSSASTNLNQPDILPSVNHDGNSAKLYVKARQLLSQFRFAGYHNHSQVLMLENSLNLREKLSALDDIPCREQYDAWCVFMTNETSSDFGERACVVTQPLKESSGTGDLPGSSNEYGQYSPQYIQFLLGMGWLINISQHQGYDGGIDTLEYEGSSLYYANAFEEVVFHQHAWNVTCRQESQCSNESLPRNRIFCSHSESAPSVIVIWNQCQQQIYPNSPLWSEFGDVRPGKHLTIFIDPIVETLSQAVYRIRTHIPSSSLYRTSHAHRPYPGPLLDGMIVSLRDLPGLIRSSIINLHRDCRNVLYQTEKSTDMKTAPSSQVARQRVINHISSDNVKDCNSLSVLSHILCHDYALKENKL